MFQSRFHLILILYKTKTSFYVKSTDAHRGREGGRGGVHLISSKDFKKFGHINAIKVIKHENRGPPRYSHNPKYPQRV
jgi:hypothetical protein